MSEGDLNESSIEITDTVADTVAERAILEGAPGQPLSGEISQRIANMTEDGIKAANGPETSGDVKFKNLLGFLERGLFVFKNTIPADYDINYQTLVRGVARGITELDDVYASIFLDVWRFLLCPLFLKLDTMFSSRRLTMK